MENAPATRFLKRNSPPHVMTLVSLAGMSAMAMNMFLPSLPSMTVYFRTEYHVMQLSVALFLALNGVLQIFIGPLSDRYGRRPVLLGGYAIFLVATVGCLFSRDVVTFLVFRCLQSGVVVGMVLSRAIVRDLYERDRAAAMIGYVTMGMSLVPMVTPAIGGVLDGAFGWQANFWVFLICGLLVFWLTWADVGETHHSRSTSFRQQFADYPELLTSPRFWGYALAAAFASGVFFSYLGGAPFVGSEVFHLTPSVLGLMFGAPALGYAFGNFISARTAVRLGINRLILTGSIICTAAIALSSTLFVAGHGSAISFFGLMTIVGLGNGLVMPNAISGTLSVRPKLAGTASGLGGALMIGGGAALSAIAGNLLTPGSGPEPLLFLQLGVSAMSIASIIMVIRRERRIGSVGIYQE